VTWKIPSDFNLVGSASSSLDENVMFDSSSPITAVSVSFARDSLNLTSTSAAVTDPKIGDPAFHMPDLSNCAPVVFIGLWNM
jgi:hypothetical protein